MKKLCLLAALVILMLALSGCGEVAVKEEPMENVNMFQIVEKTYGWAIVYDKTTKVMYAVSNVSSGTGKFTLLVNADGSPRLWEGD